MCDIRVTLTMSLCAHGKFIMPKIHRQLIACFWVGPRNDFATTPLNTWKFSFFTSSMIDIFLTVCKEMSLKCISDWWTTKLSFRRNRFSAFCSNWTLTENRSETFPFFLRAFSIYTSSPAMNKNYIIHTLIDFPIPKWIDSAVANTKNKIEKQANRNW